jgi:hypothetical protein
MSHTLQTYTLVAMVALAIFPATCGDCSLQESQVCTSSSVTVKEDNINDYAGVDAIMIAPTARAYHAGATAAHPITNTTYMVTSLSHYHCLSYAMLQALCRALSTCVLCA